MWVHALWSLSSTRQVWAWLVVCWPTLRGVRVMGPSYLSDAHPVMRKEGASRCSFGLHPLARSSKMSKGVSRQTSWASLQVSEWMREMIQLCGQVSMQ